VTIQSLLKGKKQMIESFNGKKTPGIDGITKVEDSKNHSNNKNLIKKRVWIHQNIVQIA